MIDYERAILNAKFLPDDGFDYFWNQFTNQGIKVKKLEFLQTYDFIDGNEDYKNQDYDKFFQFLKNFSQNAWGGKDNIRRLHYIKYPLDEYLKMEYYTYLINEKYGQDIRITSNRKFFPNKVYDFVLFENDNLFILDFGNNDSWRGAFHITDKQIIKEFSDWFDKVFNKSENFKSMYNPNKYLIDRLKESKCIWFSQKQT